MSPAPSKKRTAKEPEIAKPCDIGPNGLGDPRAVRKRRERLKYLFASGKRPIDSGPTPPEEEQEFWKEQIIQNPFILMRNPAYLVKGKEGYERFVPLEEQSELIAWREYCWENKYVCDIWELKARQYGGSTEAKLADLSVAIAVALMRGGVYSHTVGNETKNTQKMLRILRTALRGLPLWLRPEWSRDNDDFLEIDDERTGIVGIQFQTDTAKQGEDIGRGDPAQLRHYTEADWWWNQMGAFSALEAAQVWIWPAHQTVESTGKLANSPFHKQYIAAKTHDPNNPGRLAVFFGWFRHSKYRRPLPAGASESDFWDGIEPELLAKFQAHNCDVEQANWYMWKRQSQLDKGIPLDLFRREFPFDDVEAFLSGGSGVFDQDKMNAAVTFAGNFKKGRIADIGLTAYPAVVPAEWKPKWAKCKLVWNPDVDEEAEIPPRLEDSPFNGTITQWEKPRQGHGYTVDVDIASGKQAVPGAVESRDWTVIDVTRWTYDERVDECVFAQVAQFRSPRSKPQETARIAVGLAKLYASRSGKTPINFEQNGYGAAFEVEAKRLGGKLFAHFQQTGEKGSFLSYGMQMSAGEKGKGSKNSVVTSLVSVFETGQWRPLSEATLYELGIYSLTEKGTYEAPPGEHDDAVSAAYLMCANVAAAQRRKIITPQRVLADGGIILPDHPEEEEINTALLEATFKRHAPKAAGNKPRRRAGGWQGGV